MENYFNYFTEIEECFRRCRGTPTLLSTLDWALIEAWKESGIPLEAVLAGIERSFDKFQRRPRRFQKVNSLAYCTQEVLRAAEETKTAEVQSGGTDAKESAALFAPEEIAAFLKGNAERIAKAREAAGADSHAALAEDFEEAARALERWGTTLSTAGERELQDLETQLSALEEKLTAAMTRAASVELLAGFRRDAEQSLAPYRRRMSAAQIDLLERQFLKKRLFEHFRIPRLSLFYM